MMMEPIPNTPALFAECPVWLPISSRLCWIDCVGGRVFSYDWFSHQVSTVFAEPGVLITGLAGIGEDGLVVVTTAGIRLIDSCGVVSSAALPRSIDIQLVNDCKADRCGRFWLGAVRSGPGRTDGELLCVSPTKLSSKVLGLGIPNGPAFDAGGTKLFLADSLAGTIRQFTMNPDADLCDETVLFAVAESEGQPDGMTVDRDGFLLVALHRGGAIVRIDPETRKVVRLLCPVPSPTSCVFGGPDLRTLIVTVANGPWPENRRDPGIPSTVDASQPSLYALTMEVPGIPDSGVDLQCFGRNSENRVMP
jgi:sugar lactone lactonase YvrE